jgi:hypothetical protein
MADMLEIWQNAYDIYTNCDYAQLWDYLREQVNDGNLTYGDAETMADNIVETYNL